MTELALKDESRLNVVTSEEETIIEVDLKDVECEPGVYRLLIGNEEVIFEVK